jgi:Fic family protein
MIDLSTLIITFDILSLVSEIDEFKGEWNCAEPLTSESRDTLMKIAMAEGAGASSRLEGGLIADNKALMINNSSYQKFTNAEERYVAGYISVSEHIFRDYADLSFSMDTITQFHRDLYQFSISGSYHGVRSPTALVQTDLITDEYTEEEMDSTASMEKETFGMLEELISWVNKANSQKTIHPLLITAVFTAVFLNIKPFKGGNNTLSNILCYFLLIKAGYRYMPYCSLDSLIEQSENVYYRAFAQTAESLNLKKVNWQPGVIVFLKTLQKHKQKLKLNLERKETQINRLPDHLLQLLDLVKAKGRITISEASMLTRSNPTQIRRYLDVLVTGHHLQKHGTTKGVWYSMNV